MSFAPSYIRVAATIIQNSSFPSMDFKGFAWKSLNVLRSSHRLKQKLSATTRKSPNASHALRNEFFKRMHSISYLFRFFEEAKNCSEFLKASKRWEFDQAFWWRVTNLKKLKPVICIFLLNQFLFFFFRFHVRVIKFPTKC